MQRGVLEIGMGWFTEEPGGLNRMYAGLWRGLADSGARVRGIIAGDRRAALGAPANVSFFAPRDASLMRRFAACRSAVEHALRDGDIEVVAAHFAPYALPALDLLRHQSFVFHFHGPWAAESQVERQQGLRVRAKRLIESAVYGRAERFIVLSRAFGEVLTGVYGVPAERVHVVPGGVDAGRFATGASRREARLALGVPTDRPVIGVVRRLVRRVGLEGLVAALDAVRADVPDVLLLVGGSGPLARALETLVAERGLAEHVRFMGFVAEERLPLFYRACDLTIVPSVALEGFGLTTIESLAAGTPVLVTPVGGLPETVEGLDLGLVLPDATAVSIARALVEALRGTRRLPSAERCAEYARAEFDWSVIAAKVLAVYA
jgi:glycosyltransferase involved in cell wall biosynthesis